MLMYAYVQEGRFPEALADLEEVRRRVGGKYPGVWAWQVYVYGRWGRREQAQQALKKFEQTIRDVPWDPTLVWLFVYAGMDQKDEAIAMLQKAYSKHSNLVTLLKVDPMFDALRGDPRFQELLRRVGLAP
jgi:serine/threonine-protein kinase